MASRQSVIRNEHPDHPAIWRGSECVRTTLTPAVSTGYAELDAQLPGRGWPSGAITEIYAERTGVGEVQLTMSAAARDRVQAIEKPLPAAWVSLAGPGLIAWKPAALAMTASPAAVMVLRCMPSPRKSWFTARINAG